VRFALARAALVTLLFQHRTNFTFFDLSLVHSAIARALELSRAIDLWVGLQEAFG
jgi:hypothetical protein